MEKELERYIMNQLSTYIGKFEKEMAPSGEFIHPTPERLKSHYEWIANGGKLFNA